LMKQPLQHHRSNARTQTTCFNSAFSFPPRDPHQPGLACQKRVVTKPTAS
jgi:hypothetical protein